MIKISNITKKYNPKKSNEFEALHGVSCEINDGELVAVIGKSGAGKSTLLHILACIDNYQEGEYTIDGTLVKNLSEKQYAKIRNEKIGMVMQDFALVEDFTALENVMIPLNFSKQKIKNKKEKALAALKSVGIGELAKKPIPSFHTSYEHTYPAIPCHHDRCIQTSGNRCKDRLQGSKEHHEIPNSS